MGTVERLEEGPATMSSGFGGTVRRLGGGTRIGWVAGGRHTLRIVRELGGRCPSTKYALSCSRT